MWAEVRLSRLRDFAVLGSAGGLMVALEAWAFDLSNLLAVYLGSVSLDAHSALISFSTYTYTTLEATQGQIDILLGQIPYKCYQNRVAYVED